MILYGVIYNAVLPWEFRSAQDIKSRLFFLSIFISLNKNMLQITKPVYGFIMVLSFALLSCNKEENKSTSKNISADWMSILLDKYPTANINMLSVCMPGAHDAGMYVVQECSFGANSCNTQTQYLDMGEMLAAGIRIFDVRPIFFKNKYYTQHATDCNGLGCKGDLMDNILDDTKAFLDDHAEVVILSLGHFCNMNGNDAVFLDYLENKLGNRIYKDDDPSLPLIRKSFREILPADLQTGKVILVFESGFDNTAENRALGYFTPTVLPSDGGWSNKDNFPELKADQLSRYNSFVPDGNRLFSFSWQMTQSTGLAVSCALNPAGYSIQDMAAISNAALPLVMDSLVDAGAISQLKFPNIIWTDDADALITRACVRISEIALE